MYALQKSLVMAGVGLIFLGCGGGDGGGGEGQAVDTSQAAPGPNQVFIIVNCNGQRVDLQVQPWRRVVAGGEQVTFQLVGPSTVSSVTIEPKPGNPNAWPFESGNSITVAPTGMTTPAPNPAADLENQYNVRAQCTFPGNNPNDPVVTRDIIVDPDVIVRGSPIRNEP